MPQKIESNQHAKSSSQRDQVSQFQREYGITMNEEGEGFSTGRRLILLKHLQRPVLRMALAWMLTIFILFFAVGCGSGGQPTEPEPAESEPAETEEEPPDEEADVPDAETEEEDADRPFQLADWRNPHNLGAISEQFESLRWRWTGIADDEEQEDAVFHYRLEGPETIDGQELTRIYFDADGDEMIFWLDEAGEPVRAQIDGEPIPGELVDMMSVGFVAAMLTPFQMARHLNIHSKIRSTGTQEGWTRVSTEVERFGDLQARVSRIRLTLGPPQVPAGSEMEIMWAIAQFDDFEMLVEWNVDGEADGNDFAMYMRVEEVTPRQ